MMPFEVVCVDNDGIEEYYKIGWHYNVRAVNGDALWLVGANGFNEFWLMANRFKKLPIDTKLI